MDVKVVLDRGIYGVVTARGDTATKTVLSDDIDSAIREIVFLRRCAHPNVVALLDYDVGEGVCIEIMMPRYVCSLWDAWDRAGKAGDARPSMRTIESQILDLATAVAHVHSVGVIHGDIKPKNILLGHNGELVLCDFGISVDMGEVRHRAEIVTVNYRAPEIDAYDGLYGPAIDVWSLGVVMIEVIRGRALTSRVDNNHPSPARTRAAELFGVASSALYGMCEIDRRTRIWHLCCGHDDGPVELALGAVVAIISAATQPLSIDRLSSDDLLTRVEGVFKREHTTIAPARTHERLEPPRLPKPASYDPTCPVSVSRRVVDMILRDESAGELALRLYVAAFDGCRLLACCLVAGSITRRSSAVCDRISQSDNMASVCTDAIRLMKWLDSVELAPEQKTKRASV